MATLFNKTTRTSVKLTYQAVKIPKRTRMKSLKTERKYFLSYHITEQKETFEFSGVNDFNESSTLYQENIHSVLENINSNRKSLSPENKIQKKCPGVIGPTTVSYFPRTLAKSLRPLCAENTICKKRSATKAKVFALYIC